MSPASITEPPPAFRSANRRPLMLAVAGVMVLVVVAVVVAFLPKQGSLVVTVAGPGNKSVSELEVYVDGQKRCSTSPCQVKELGAGTHLVKVTAAGYQATADQAVKVASGDEAVLNVSMNRGGSGPGLKVTSEGRGLKLYVDGKEIGPLPQELTDITPGEHMVRIDGGDRYEPFEKSVTISSDQMLTLDPKLKVKKGLATIKPGLNAEGARVVLVSGNERRPVPSLPLTVDIPMDKPYSMVASKRGFQDVQQKLEFEDGQAERTFVIDFVPPVTTAEDMSAAVSRSAPAAPRAAAPRAAAPVAAAPKASATTGTLNINSNPVSNVILDGRPLGPTPKIGVSVSPGSHTVIFAHPEHGRKAKSVNVTAGKTSSVVVRF
jgi:serine/threonine-protein kinase